MSLFGKSQRDEARAPVGPAHPATAPPAPRDPVFEQRRGSPLPIGAGGGMANIGKSITIRGDLTGNEDLVIEGDVEGKVELPNNELTIGANGKVRADVQAKAVIVVGRVSGNVSATDRVEIQASGVVDGDVHAPRLVVQEGAVINGGVSMGEKKPVPSGLAKPPLPRVAAGGELP